MTLAEQLKKSFDDNERNIGDVMDILWNRARIQDDHKGVQEFKMPDGSTLLVDSSVSPLELNLK